MPDHIYLFWLGLKLASDQRNAMSFVRKHLQAELARCSPHRVKFELQKQSHDRVLREKDRRRVAFAGACYYVLHNPRRNDRVVHPRDWPYWGTVIPGWPAGPVPFEGMAGVAAEAEVLVPLCKAESCLLLPCVPGG
jgi:hypothetical protein